MPNEPTVARPLVAFIPLLVRANGDVAEPDEETWLADLADMKEAEKECRD